MTRKRQKRCLMFFYPCIVRILIKFNHGIEKSSENKIINQSLRYRMKTTVKNITK